MRRYLVTRDAKLKDPARTALSVDALKARFDALPSKLIVSLACGVPPIFTGEGEAARLVSGGRCGVVVPPEDPEALRRAVEQLADDPAYCGLLAGNARALAEREYAWEQIVDSWLAGVLPRLRDQKVAGAAM